jgi:uncharacterized protein
MNLTENITQDLKVAMKGGLALELRTLRSIRALILEFEKKKVGNVMTEEDEIQLLSSAAKARREAIEQYRLGGRADLAEEEAKELEIIQRYLPQQLDETELIRIVEDVIRQSGATDVMHLGKVMGPVMKIVKGRADGTAVQGIVKKLLGGE